MSHDLTISDSMTCLAHYKVGTLALVGRRVGVGK